MRILILGGDGYLGWPTAMRLTLRGHSVMVADNYLRRRLEREVDAVPLYETPDLGTRAAVFAALTEKSICTREGDCTRHEFVDALIRDFQPGAVVHFAEQPSAPYSMMGAEQARLTLENNVGTTFTLIWALLRHAPECHIVKLGTMGEYGTPNIDIEEGWIDVAHRGRSDRFLFPRQGSSLYHTTKILDTDLLHFYARNNGLRVTDLMQGPVYGLTTTECDMDPRLATHFNYDAVFGTVLNRFLVQAVAGMPLTVYGRGGQTRGFLNIEDTLQCIELAINTPAQSGELRILNQFTEQFSVRELAGRVCEVGNRLGLNVAIASLANPRREKEEHYYNAQHHALAELGLEPHLLTEDVIGGMLERVLPYRDAIDVDSIKPRVQWSLDA